MIFLSVLISFIYFSVIDQNASKLVRQRNDLLLVIVVSMLRSMTQGLELLGSTMEVLAFVHDGSHDFVKLLLRNQERYWLCRRIQLLRMSGHTLLNVVSLAIRVSCFFTLRRLSDLDALRSNGSKLHSSPHVLKDRVVEARRVFTNGLCPAKMSNESGAVPSW